MLLLTTNQRERLLQNGKETAAGNTIDPFPVVKLFMPDADCTWLLTEIDPFDLDMAFGLCDLGLGFPEIGWVSLREIADIRGRLGLPIERDLHFTGDKSLSAYAEIARQFERIVT